jgi:hypothetical protein
MRKLTVGIAVAVWCVLALAWDKNDAKPDPVEFRVGFAQADVTPKLGEQPVYLAGFGHNRKATGIRDPLKARAVVFESDGQRIGICCVDVIGLFHDIAERVRARLPDFDFVVVSSTHNHDGPDTMGLWGSAPVFSGVDRGYLRLVEDQVVVALRAAADRARPARARIGSARDPGLLRDTRKPIVKLDELVAIECLDAESDAKLGVIVQWNCHPETMDSKNTLVSSDFVGPAVEYLHRKIGCPVIYLTGAVGGLMTPLGLDIKDRDGKPLTDVAQRTTRYGELVGQLAEKALTDAMPARLAPMFARSQRIFVPIDNDLYRLAGNLGVVERQVYYWTGDPTNAKPAPSNERTKPVCLLTEVGWLRLGDLDIALFPGEIYPELVLGKVEDPAVEGADFPEAPVEPALYDQLRGPHRMIVGLANDEIGYVIPKRQWDAKPPYCYGLKKPPYGEINSVGPEAAPLLCTAFRDLVRQGR